MKKTISFKRILQQLKADLIGKDSHRGITLTYAWLANQFGHISLGFIPSYLLFAFFNLSAVKSAIYVSLFWFLFELYNFLGPLLSKKEKYIFKPQWINLGFDTFTDVCFFILGSIFFVLTIVRFTNKVPLIILGILLVYLYFASRYWFVTKMYQFYAKFPFQFRLSQWDFKMNTNDKLKVDNFLESSINDGNQLLIYGDFGSGKTSLGVGILNELSIKNNSCLYKSGIKMFNSFFDDEDDIKSYELWNWKTTNFLMIDDINPSKPIERELISPQKLLSFIDTQKPENSKNRALLKSKNIIWVLGSKQNLDKGSKDEWKQMLSKIGITENRISIINLEN